MPRSFIGTFGLPEALKAEGFPIPDDCREARIVMSVGSAIVIQYEVLLTDEKLAQLGRALQRLASDPRT